MRRVSSSVTPEKKRVRVSPMSHEPLTPEEHAAAQAVTLAEYAKYGNVSDACRKAGISRTTYYRWLEEDETFKQRVEQAKDDYCDSLRGEITRRARDGVLKPVFQGGVKVGSIREFSDTLLIFEAKRHMPEYRDRQQVDVEAHAHVTITIAQRQAIPAAQIVSETPDDSGDSEAPEDRP